VEGEARTKFRALEGINGFKRDHCRKKQVHPGAHRRPANRKQLTPIKAGGVTQRREDAKGMGEMWNGMNQNIFAPLRLCVKKQETGIGRPSRFWVRKEVRLDMPREKD